MLRPPILDGFLEIFPGAEPPVWKHGNRKVHPPEILAAFKKTPTIRGVARAFGVSRSTIKRIVDPAKWKKTRMSRKVDVTLAWNQYRAGFTCRDIAEYFDTQRAVVGYMLDDKYGEEYRSIRNSRQGTYGGGPKLKVNVADIKDWFVRLENGATTTVISAMGGITVSSVISWLRRYDEARYERIIDSRSRYKRTFSHEEATRMFFAGSESAKQIAEYFDVDYTTVRNILKKQPGYRERLKKKWYCGKTQAVFTPDGDFVTIVAAANHHGIDRNVAARLARNNVAGWGFRR